MTLKVTLLSSEWKSSTNGDLSTINRELAIQLAKHSDVDVSVLLPTYDDVDWSSAESHNVKLIKAVKVPGCDPVFCLSFPPRGHKMDCVIGHGVNLGRPIAAIKMNSDYSLCKWIQVVHSDLEEDGMYKGISEGQKMRETEIKYCKMADQVITIGPKLAEAYKRYLCPVKQEKKVFDLTPSIFSEFLAVEQATEERQMFHILVTGSVDSCEDFIVKGYDIAAKAIAELKDESYKLKFVCTAKGKDILVKRLPQHGLNCNQFNVRSCDDGRKMLADLFCEVDLAIMPSRMEGFGITALEALSAALPVLVSGNSGLGEALKKVPIGTQSVVDSEDHTDWAREIKRVRQKERDVRLSESRFLREKYLAKYSWEEPCKSLVIKMKNLVFGKALYNSLDCEETERNQQSESLPVQIPIRIDCGTILDRHPRCETSGTVVIASQGTQACSDGLIVTETSEGTPQDTQDSQAGSHDLLVTGVQCEAVEPVASAGQPLAGRTGSVEEAGVGNEALPATQEVLNFIALKYFKEIGPSKPEEFNGFLHYCKEVRKVLIVDVQPGSLILTALCSSLEILDSLWYDYCTGHLNDMAQKYLVTEDVLKEFDLTELKLTTTIQMEEYIAAQKFFLQDSEKAPNTSLERKRTDGNEETKSVQGTTPCDSTEEVRAATSMALEGKAPQSSNDKEQTQRKELLTAAGNLPHSGLKVGKRDGREQSESVPAKQDLSKTKETERNRLSGFLQPDIHKFRRTGKTKMQGMLEESESGSTSLSEDNKELNQLHSAERDSDVTEMKYTLPLGFSVDRRDAAGRTPLMKAALYVNFPAVKNLIKRGADPSLVDNEEWNSLHFAAKGGETDIIDLIHTHLLNIGSKTGEGYTPLMVAAFSGKLHAVQWFLERGANPWAKDNKGKDSFFHASSCDSDVLDLLKSHVAKSAAPHDSTEQTQRNKKEAWTATGTAVEAHEKEKVPYHTSRKDLADEESATVDAVDDQKTLIRRGKIGGEEGTWHLREAGASIKLCSGAVQQPVPFTCFLWNPRTLSPPIASDEILVSSVIELSFDGPPDPEYRESVEGISFTVALLHSAPDLEGYEVVIKQLIDQENNEWKELKTENTWHGSETSSVPKWLFPFAQAICAKPAVSSFAAIWRPKSFTFSRGTAVGPELTCVVPDFPDVSVQIPQSCVPVNEDFCVTIKVQEFPSSELKGEGGLVGPGLYISGSQNVTLVAPVTIRIPLTLRKEKKELAALCPGELRILHCESLVEPHDWKDITDQLDEPPLLLDGRVQFKVRHFSGFRPIKLIGSLLQPDTGLKKFVGKLSWRHRPQHARFLTCLCKTNVRRQFVLKLFCYPQKLVYDVSQQISRIKMRYIAEGSSVEPVCEKEEILVSFSEAIILQGEDDGTAIFVSFSNKRVVFSDWVVCLGSESVPVVKFCYQSNKILCKVTMVKTSQVPNPVTFDHEEGNAIYVVKDGEPTEETLEFLSVELAEKWEALGRRLKFNQTAITNFDKPNEAFKMLLAWKRREGSTATYKALYDALCHDLVECKRLAEQFCCDEIVGNASP